jgi:hypothetical protein
MISAPLMLSLNFGAGSSKKCEKPFGWFISGGYGYYRTNKTGLVPIIRVLITRG